MNADNTILIVEDEPDLAGLLKQYVEAAGYQARVVYNGLQVMPSIDQQPPTLILLDLMLPGKSGLDLCKEIRARGNTPIIITTAKVEEIDRLLGLELGADDYICKPYSPREVIARIKTVLRRMEHNHGDSPPIQLVSVDPDKLTVSLRNITIELTQIEFNLFHLLYSQPGKIFSRQHILDNIYQDYRIVSDRTVDSHIKKLRKKLHDAVPEVDVIKSIYGVGYKFEPDFPEA